jgi:heterogeneous nuclear rnp K-like protein 2
MRVWYATIYGRMSLYIMYVLYPLGSPLGHTDITDQNQQPDTLHLTQFSSIPENRITKRKPHKSRQLVLYHCVITEPTKKESSQFNTFFTMFSRIILSSRSSIMRVPLARFSSAAAQSDDTIVVPKNLVKFLIGVRGRNLQSLTERSGGAQVYFNKEELNGEEVAKILGDARQVAEMKKLIQEDLAKFKSEYSEDVINSNQQVSRPGELVEEVVVESAVVAGLIGKQGTTLREMQSETGASIQYSVRDDHSTTRTARIRGTPAQVSAAKKLIQSRINDLNENRMRNMGGDYERRDDSPRPSRRSSSFAGDSKQVVEVPSDIVGSLIGKGGKNLFSLQDASGARVDFAREDHRDGAREVTISGTEQQIKEACNLLQNRVQAIIDRGERQ